MKVALVTGASGGIGLATCRKFLEEDYFVVAQYNDNFFPIEKLGKEIGKSDYIFSVKADFANFEDVRRMCDTVKSQFKHIDAIVTLAGIDLYKLFTETTENEWDRVFGVNVKATYLVLKEFIPLMVERKSGKIVLVSSIWGNVGASMESVYSASKSALIGLTKSLAKELALSGVNVNCVSPGVIDTPMNDCFTESEKRELINATPLGRMGKAYEIAELIYFLCSEKSSFITGQNITSDGGFTL